MTLARTRNSVASPFQYAQETVDRAETHGRLRISRAWLSSAKRIVQLEPELRRRLEAAKPTLQLV